MRNPEIGHLASKVLVFDPFFGRSEENDFVRNLEFESGFQNEAHRFTPSAPEVWVG